MQGPAPSVPYPYLPLTYHALSLNEMGAVPGGAFRAFWEPLYKMSISRSATINRTHQTQTYAGNRNSDVLLCLSIKIGAAPSEATVSTRNRQLCLCEIRPITKYHDGMESFLVCSVWDRWRGSLTFCICLQCRLQGDRGLRRTLRVSGKTGQVCVFLWPGIDSSDLNSIIYDFYS